MKTFCAWCNREMYTEHTIKGPAITHGICNDCMDNVRFQYGAPVQEYIDSLSQPVCIVDDTGTVITANRSAQTMLQKKLDSIRGNKGGEVFECAYARLPEGCGNTIHCSGCAIRRTVMDSHATGEPHYRVPATLKPDSLDRNKDIALFISTEKVGEVVYLRIDDGASKK